MALAQCLLASVLLIYFYLSFASLGNGVLRLLRFEIDSNFDHLLVALAIGLVVFEILLFIIQFTGHIRAASLAMAISLGIPLFVESTSVFPKVRGVACSLRLKSGFIRFLLFFAGTVLCVEFLTSLAPLTGSDALHYHFTVQKLILEQGFHPLFSNVHSFLCGQYHLLILFGLALGSEKLALGFIFAGGALSASVLASLAARRVSDRLMLGVALLFLLTPIVFWQITASGAPDIYMAFFAATALIVLTEGRNPDVSWQRALVSGLLVGGVAGAKYTGSLIAASLAFAFLLEFRNGAQAAVLTLGSLIAGIWPYLRNTIWTGNPVFPFLSDKLSPHLVTTFALKSLANDTGASIGHNWGQVLPFVFFAAVRTKNVGFWDFFGPTVFATAPLICFAFKNTREWRILVLVWFTSSLEIFLASGLSRFLLPIFPIALVCAASGVEGSVRRDWKIASGVSVGIMALMIVSGAMGLALYCTEPFLTAIGLRSNTAYLEDRSQGYNVAQAINHILAEPGSAGKTLLFLRHEYYVHVPYLNGDPGTSLEVDPERLKTPEQWKVFLKLKGIAYVVRAPDYPAAIASPLKDLEKSGLLIPVQQLAVEDLKGMRIDQVRSTVPVVVLEVNF